MVHPPAYLKQGGCFTTLDNAALERSGFPGRNRCMISSSPVAQSGGREVHDNCVLDRHVAHRAHKDTLDPGIRKRESTTVVRFGHILKSSRRRAVIYMLPRLYQE